MTERKIKLKLDSFELRLLINALVEWRNRLLAEVRYNIFRKNKKEPKRYRHAHKTLVE